MPKTVTFLCKAARGSIVVGDTKDEKGRDLPADNLCVPIHNHVIETSDPEKIKLLREHKGNAANGGTAFHELAPTAPLPPPDTQYSQGPTTTGDTPTKTGDSAVGFAALTDVQIKRMTKDELLALLKTRAIEQFGEDGVDDGVAAVAANVGLGIPDGGIGDFTKAVIGQVLNALIEGGPA